MFIYFISKPPKDRLQTPTVLLGKDIIINIIIITINSKLWSQTPMVHIPIPPFTSWVTMGKFLYLSVPQSLNMKEENSSAPLTDCLAEIMPVKLLTQCQTLT